MSGGNPEAARSVTDMVLPALTEIASISGIPVSTPHRLVAELTEWQLISRSSNGRCQLGLRVWELAQKVGRQLRDTASDWSNQDYRQMVSVQKEAWFAHLVRYPRRRGGL